MPTFIGFEYEAGPELNALPTNATGYQYPPGAAVESVQVAELAAALGVEGEPVAGGGSDVDGLAWRVGPDDGSAPMLTVGADPQVSVYYSQAWNTAVGVGCVVAEDGESSTAVGNDDVTTEPASTCDEPEPPVNVPTAEQAESLAGDVLVAVGLDPATFEFETYADEWAASVTAWSRLDGVRSPIAWAFGFGANSELQWMNGTLATPVATGPFPLIGLDEALERLDEQNTWGAGLGGVFMDDTAVTVGAELSGAGEPAVPAPTEGGTATPETPAPIESVPVESVPVESVAVETLPVESVPVDTVPVEVAPEIATLVDVRADLWWAWDDDGSVWLLPAYTFTDTEERVFTVPSVTDEFLIIADPVLVDPLPMDPVPVESLPEEVPEPDLSYIVGLAVADATEAVGGSFTLRVVIDDGVPLAVTDDFNPSRANIEIADGVVVAVVSIG